MGTVDSVRKAGPNMSTWARKQTAAAARRLQQGDAEEVAVVRTREEYLAATRGRVPHIELRAHIVFGAHGLGSGLPDVLPITVSPAIKSISGNCTGQPLPDVKTISRTELQAVRSEERQCLTVVGSSLAFTFAGDVWYDGILSVFLPATPDFRPQGGRMQISGNFWATASAFHWVGNNGDVGCLDCPVWERGGVDVQGALYAERTLFSGFRGPSLIYTHSNASTVLHGCSVTSSMVMDGVLTARSGPTGIPRGTGALVAVTRSRFTNNTAPAVLLSTLWEEGQEDVFYSDAEHPVARIRFNSGAGVQHGPDGLPNVNATTLPISQLPVARVLSPAGSEPPWPGTDGDEAWDEYLRGAPVATVLEGNNIVEVALSSPPPPMLPSSSGNKPLTDAAVAGIVAGAAALLLGVAAAVCLLLHLRSKQRMAVEAKLQRASPAQAVTSAMVVPSEASEASRSPACYRTQGEPHTLASLPSKAVSGVSLAGVGTLAGLVGEGSEGYWSCDTWLAENVIVSHHALPGGLTLVNAGSGLTAMGSTVGATEGLLALDALCSPVDKLQAQIEWINIRQDGILLDFLKLTPHLGKKTGGQGAVVFAHHINAPMRQYAIKFFMFPRAFEVEKAAACDPDLRAAMPPVALVQSDAHVLAQETADLPAPLNAWPLPPLIVYEKGESLDEFAARSAPDFFTSLQVVMHIGRKLEALHAAGWVHRDLKPGNAIWLPSSNSWTLIDFGSAARIGAEADMSFTVKYAPPETIAALQRGDKRLNAEATQDVWAFGIICFELLTHRKYYGTFADVDAVVSRLASEAPLPTEQELEPEVRAALGPSAFCRSIQTMLSRNPRDRPSVSHLLATWQAVFQRPGGDAGEQEVSLRGVPPASVTLAASSRLASDSLKATTTM